MQIKTKVMATDTSILGLVIALITTGIALAQSQNLYTQIIGIVLILSGILLFAIIQFVKYKGMSAVEDLIGPITAGLLIEDTK